MNMSEKRKFLSFTISLVFSLFIRSLQAQGYPRNATYSSTFTYFPDQTPEDRSLDSKLILVDEEYKRLYFTSPNFLHSTTLDLKDEKVYDLSPAEETLKTCMESYKNGQAKENCRNHLKLLVYDFEGNIFVCGTNALSPKCWCYNRTENGLELIKKSTGFNRSPAYTNRNSSIVFSDPFYFVGTRGSRFNAIRKFKLGEDKTLAATANKKTVFSNPRYVSAHTFSGSNYAYFFFYEDAIENTERKSIYSRVGRVCKYDAGNIYDLKVFYTFLKSELKCFKKGEQLDTYYDILRATKYVEVRNSTTYKMEKFIYALFATTNERDGTALCRYKMEDMQRLFDESNLFVKENYTWVSKPMSAIRKGFSRPKCDKEVKASYETSDEELTEAKMAKENPLLYDDVTPFDGQALWTHSTKSLISFDMVDKYMFEDKSDIGMQVVFLGSQHGEVLKVMLNSTGKGTPWIVETLVPFKNRQPIHAVSINKDDVYVASRDGIASFKLQRCTDQRDCTGCVGLRDPYCAWSISQKKCLLAKSIQDISDRLMNLRTGKADSCPQTKRYFSCNLTTVQHLPGRETILKCSASSNESVSQPNIIAWNFEKKPLKPDVESGVTFQPDVPTTEQILTVRDVTPSNAGRYECIIELEDEKKQCSVTIDVAAVPSPMITTTSSTVTTGNNVINNSTQRHTTRKTPSNSKQSATQKGVTTQPKTTPKTTTVNVLPVKKYVTSYLHAFIVALIICIILVIILILVCICRYKKTQAATETDGKQNGHANGQVVFKIPFSKKYKMNRRDSANKELIKKKNKNQVYKDTTLEMNEVDEKTPV